MVQNKKFARVKNGFNTGPTFEMFSESRARFGLFQSVFTHNTSALLPKITSVNHRLFMTGDMVLFVQQHGYCILLLTSQPVFSYLYNTAHEHLHTYIAPVHAQHSMHGF